MPDLPLYFSTAACWLLLSAMAWRASRPPLTAPAGGPPQGAAPRGSELRVDAVLVPVALVLHGMLAYRQILSPGGLDLGVANAISLIVWLTVVIYWLAGLAYQGLASILGLMAPVALNGRVGTLKMMVDGKPLLELPVVALEEVSQASWFGRIWDSIRLWLQ